MSDSANEGLTTAPPVERLSATIDRCPYGHYAQARERGVYYDEHDAAWIVSSYDAVKEVCLEEETFARVKPGEAVPAERYVRILGGHRHASGLVGQERLDHRKWWLSLFTRAKVEAYRAGLVADVIEAQLDRIAPLGRAELVGDYTGPVSMGVIAGILGLPWDDEAWMAQFGDHFNMLESYRSLVYLAPGRAEAMAEDALRATEEIDELVRPYVERARRGDNDSIMSRIWHDPALAAWSDADRYDTVRTFFAAGSGTTRAAMAAALSMLLREPELRATLQNAHAPVIANFVEEALRLNGPVHFRTRLAQRDAQIDGHAISQGDKVVAILASANRDEHHYPHADEVDLERANPRSHLAFLAGIGACAGSPVARVELEEGVARLLARLPDMELDLALEAPTMEGLGIRMYGPLHVAFTPVPVS